MIRTTSFFAVSFAGLLVAVGSARAGLYLPAEPDPWPLPTDPKPYLDRLRPLQSVVSTEERVQDNDFPVRVRKQVEKLEKEEAAGKLTVEGRLNLGGYYILLAKYPRAIEVLMPAYEEDRRNFKVLANLANAYWGQGEYRSAISYQMQVLDNWPKEHKGWTAEQVAWYRRVEQAHLQLFRSRSGEQRQRKPINTVDDLFPGLRFVGPEGKYVPGKLALQMKAKLPQDALPLVEQLLLWMPHDNRLFWLYAELLNARGEVRPAATILRELVYSRGAHFEELKEHRQILLNAVETDPKYQPKQPELPTPELPAADPTASTDSGWMPNWRQLAIGFGAGLLVGVLVMFQLRQIGRRSAQADRRLSRV